MMSVGQGYRVLHRPWAFVQWLPYAAKLPEDFVLMAEPDHIFLHIPPLWCATSFSDPPLRLSQSPHGLSFATSAVGRRHFCWPIQHYEVCELQQMPRPLQGLRVELKD